MRAYPRNGREEIAESARAVGRSEELRFRPCPGDRVRWPPAADCQHRRNTGTRPRDQAKQNEPGQKCRQDRDEKIQRDADQKWSADEEEKES